MNFDLQSLLYTLPAILIALTLHEYAHGLVATWLGDPTPRENGRLSLNPLHHLDPVGTLLLIFFRFGWAKPVMVNPLYFRGNRKAGMAKVAIAGPLMNILLAYLAILLLSAYYHTSLELPQYLISFLLYFVIINLVLASFNLIPIPPLDGSKILAWLLPDRYYHWVYTLERYGSIVLVLLIVTGLTSVIFSPILRALGRLVCLLSGFPFELLQYFI